MLFQGLIPSSYLRDCTSEEIQEIESEDADYQAKQKEEKMIMEKVLNNFGALVQQNKARASVKVTTSEVKEIKETKEVKEDIKTRPRKDSSKRMSLAIGFGKKNKDKEKDKPIPESNPLSPRGENAAASEEVEIQERFKQGVAKKNKEKVIATIAPDPTPLSPARGNLAFEQEQAEIQERLKQVKQRTRGKAVAFSNEAESVPSSSSSASSFSASPSSSSSLSSSLSSASSLSKDDDKPPTSSSGSGSAALLNSIVFSTSPLSNYMMDDNDTSSTSSTSSALMLSPRTEPVRPKLTKDEATIIIRRNFPAMIYWKRFRAHLKDPQYKSGMQRNKVAREILSTERTYVQSLQTLVNVILTPLKESKNKVLDDKQRQTVFCNGLFFFFFPFCFPQNIHSFSKSRTNFGYQSSHAAEFGGASQELAQEERSW